MSKLPDRVMLSHGSGGTAMSDLVDEVFLAAYGDTNLPGDDSAVLAVEAGAVAFTTDAFVVEPIFFPGGDIGRLAIAGTVNDILTSGAKPIAISASFVIEEGFMMDDLRTIAASMRRAADECAVRIVTGDTKVVPRGAADKIFVTTSGIGVVLRRGISGASAVPGDNVILTGSIGDHGMAVMLAREHLLEADEITSDVAPLTDIVLNLLDSGCEIHAMRDPTRGGVGSALNEIARQSDVMIAIEEERIKIRPAVRAACEALGLDPLYVANEGKMLIIVPPEHAERALSIVRSSRYGDEAEIVGQVHAAPASRVQMSTTIGTSRILPPPTGELLPRIC